MTRAWLFAAALAAIGCSHPRVPCPADSQETSSTFLRSSGEWSEPHPSSTRVLDRSCRAIVAGPFLSPNLAHVGYVQDRGDDRVFVVDGRHVLRFKNPEYLHVGVNGTGNFFVLAPGLQLFVHRERAPRGERWRGTLECPVCKNQFNRGFDVICEGAMDLEVSKDGELYLLTVPDIGHRQMFALDTATPKWAPTSDDYHKLPEGAGLGMRVWLGKSQGPVFDSVRAESFRRDSAGAIHYDAIRERRSYHVVDNVIANEVLVTK